MIEFFLAPFIAFSVFIAGFFGSPPQDPELGVAPRILRTTQGVEFR